MVRLYKALMATGASVEIKPAKEFYGMFFIFRYKGKQHKCCIDMLDPEKYLEETEDMVIRELYSFVKYVNALDGEFVSC